MNGIILPVELSITIIILLFLQVMLPLVSFLTSIYFLYIFISSPKRPKHPLPPGLPTKKFLVLAPARNEANVINRLLDSLRQINYPPELLDVLIIADNCSDTTAEVVREAGFKVLERHDPTGQSKADALNWAFYDQGLLDAGYDAITIVDSDSILNSDFFLYVEAKLREGAQVIQANRSSLNFNDSFVTSAMSIYFSFENRLWWIPHANHGLSTVLLGSGSTITCAHLRQIGWNIRTLGEDTEFSIHTILAGVRVHYIDDAKVLVEIPTTFKLLWRQLRRWFSTNIACTRYYLPAIWRKFRQERGGQSSAILIQLLIPYNCTIGLVQLFLGAFTTYELLGGRIPLAAVLTGLLINQLIGMGAALLILLLDGRLNWHQLRNLWKGILFFPYWSLFMGLIYLITYIFPKKKWDLMVHNVNEPLE